MNEKTKSKNEEKLKKKETNIKRRPHQLTMNQRIKWKDFLFSLHF